MNKKKIYICGEVTGDPNYQKKFLKEENRLFALGYEPVNPASFILRNEEWSKAMRTAIKAMFYCDGISLLPDWKKSKGAKIEERLARDLGIEVRDSKKWEGEKVVEKM
jgi:hypothetical protein